MVRKIKVTPNGMSAQHEGNTFDLVDGVFCKLDNKIKAIGPDSLTEEQTLVYRVWSALGVIENGSFQYFFENDRDAEATAVSFQELGFSILAECFRLARSLLPLEYDGADWDRRLQLLQERETLLDELAKKVASADKQIERRLAEYILTHPNLALFTNN